MTTELQFPDSRHNHAPRCCCSPDDMGRGIIICSACPEHGELAPTVECPQCRQPAGRPHTEYCPLAIREEVFGQTSQPATRTSQPHTVVNIHGQATPDLAAELRKAITRAARQDGRSS